MHQIMPGLFEIRLNGVNAHLIAHEDGLLLIDTGSPGDEVKITNALAEIGRTPADLTHIIVTHCHPDHAGSLAALQRNTHALTIMHGIDGAMVQAGNAMRPLYATPGPLNWLLMRLIISGVPDEIDPGRVDRFVEDGELLPVAGGLRVLHTPGHSAGQIALLWEREGVLFAADAVMNQPWLGYHIAYEDFAQGQNSAARLATMEFGLACFGHGKPLVENAAARFRRKFDRS